MWFEVDGELIRIPLAIEVRGGAAIEDYVEAVMSGEITDAERRPVNVPETVNPSEEE